MSDEEAVRREAMVAADRTWTEFEKLGDRLEELHREHGDEQALDAFRLAEDLVMDLDDVIYAARKAIDDGGDSA